MKSRGLRLFCRPLAPLFFFCLPVFLHANALEDSRRTLLANILNERKIPFETRSLFAEFGGFSSSIHILLPAEAEEKKPGIFILALPLSFTGDDQREFPYAFQVALDFIGRVRAEGLETDVMAAFLGDERSSLRSGQSAPHLGLLDLYSRLEVPEDAVMIYLDICGETGEIVVHHGARRTLAPLNILRPLAQICAERKIPYTLAVNANELYKLGLADGPSALEFALRRETPALYLGEGAPGSIRNLDAALFDYARALSPGTENPDYHYLIFQVLKRFFFVSERATTLFFLAVAGLFFFTALIYSLVFRRRLVVQWKVFFKRSWILFIYWLTLCLALKAAALIFRFIARGADPARFEGAALLFHAAAALQLLLGISLFALFSFPGDRIYVPRRANFYGSSAIILVIVELLLSAYIDITFIPMFVWAFMFTFLAACVKKPVLIWLCGLLSFFMGISAMLTVIQAGNRQLGLLIFSGNTAFILYIAFISLPFFITLKRGVLLRSRKTEEKKSLPDILKQLISPGVALKSIAPRLIVPAAAAAALALSVHFLARSPVIGARQRILEDEPGNAVVLALDVQDRTLLERRTLNITLSAPGNPLRFNLRLDSVAGGEMPVIYSAAMPFRYIEDANSPSRSSIEFILGEDPPNPFSTEIVLPAEFAGFLSAEALYVPMEDNYQISIRRRYPIGFGQQFY
ncbi:MAG: hypothetical protein LBK63_10670 [Treponema sp.]|jgi:hypothetical protein|nr:hypothetical protein [Treponema sp.]